MPRDSGDSIQRGAVQPLTTQTPRGCEARTGTGPEHPVQISPAGHLHPQQREHPVASGTVYVLPCRMHLMLPRR